MARGRTVWTIAGLTALSASAALVLVVSPPFIALAFAVTGAGLWCWWLDEHPERDETSGGLSRA